MAKDDNKLEAKKACLRFNLDKGEFEWVTEDCLDSSIVTKMTLSDPYPYK